MTIPTIRKQLRAAAEQQPALKPFTNLLSDQLRNFDRENNEGKAALRPEIEKNIRRLEAARDGR